MISLTENRDVLIEDISERGSAFATTKEGEAVFIPARFVENLALQPMEVVHAMLLPNYPDHRDKKPWRAISIKRIEDQGPKPVTKVAARLEDRILSLMESGEVFSNTDLSEDLEEDIGVVGNATAKLFNDGKIVKAEVFRKPGQTRPSFLLYAINIEAFE